MGRPAGLKDFGEVVGAQGARLRRLQPHPPDGEVAPAPEAPEALTFLMLKGQALDVGFSRALDHVRYKAVVSFLRAALVRESSTSWKAVSRAR